MYSIFVIGTALWIFYGLSTNNMPIVLANSITEMLALIILYYKVKEKKKFNYYFLVTDKKIFKKKELYFQKKSFSLRFLSSMGLESFNYKK